MSRVKEVVLGLSNLPSGRLLAMLHTTLESPAKVQARLDLLCETFQKMKPALVANWSVEV